MSLPIEFAEPRAALNKLSSNDVHLLSEVNPLSSEAQGWGKNTIP